MIHPPNKKSVAEAVSDKVQETAAQLHEVYSPQWGSRVEVLKTIVTLSSASIVLTVSFSSSLRNIHAASVWRYVIVFSFVMFVISLILAFVALRFGTRLYEVQSSVFQERQTIQAALIRASSQEEFLKTFDDIMKRAFRPIERIDKSAAWLFVISSACFCLAVISLAVVGSVQLLSEPIIKNVTN